MKLILDLSKPEVAEMVAGWVDGGRYRIELDPAVQIGIKGNLAEFDVEGITDYGDSNNAAAPTGQGLQALTAPPAGGMDGAEPPAPA